MSDSNVTTDGVEPMKRIDEHQAECHENGVDEALPQWDLNYSNKREIARLLLAESILRRNLADDLPSALEQVDELLSLSPFANQKVLYKDVLPCAECGQVYAQLELHLKRDHKMQWMDYLMKHNLPSDTLKTAPTLSATRARNALQAGKARQKKREEENSSQEN